MAGVSFLVLRNKLVEYTAIKLLSTLANSFAEVCKWTERSSHLKVLENYHFWSDVGWKWKFRRSLTCWGSVNVKSFWLRQTSLFCSVSSTSTFSHSSFDRYLFYRSDFSGCWELNDFPHSATLMFIPSWKTLRSEIWFTELMISGLSVRDVKSGRRWFVGFQAVEWHLWHLRGQTIGEKNHLKWMKCLSSKFTKHEPAVPEFIS